MMYEMSLVSFVWGKL